jgi:hypothetical protein
LFRTTLFILFAAMAVSIVVLALRLDDQTSPVDAESVALDLVNGGSAQEVRRDGDRWEVDVVRPDGSMVQVNLGDDLDLRSFDEEVGPAGTLAPDELRGRERAGAARVALARAGPGVVDSVERDRNGDIDVRIETWDGLVEVELDRRFNVLEVERQDPRDE